ncbi:MAG: hypothetical protein JW751_11625 [Polyangiaceae bacterium]|nr:hypothetical protein [Polyangiaceae bacterium]
MNLNLNVRGCAPLLEEPGEEGVETLGDGQTGVHVGSLVVTDGRRGF